MIGLVFETEDGLRVGSINNRMASGALVTNAASCAVLGVVAVFLFLWGVFQLIYKADDPAARDKGKMHVLYGLFGVFVIVSAKTFIYFIGRFFYVN